jgi:hypothetical protein
MARFRTLAGKVGAVLFTILSAFLFTPYYIRGMEEDLSLRTRLYLVVWTEWAGAMFCGFLLLCCIWHPDDSEMVFFRMHFRGAALSFIIAMLTIHFVWKWRQALKELQSLPANSNRPTTQ